MTHTKNNSIVAMSASKGSSKHVNQSIYTLRIEPLYNTLVDFRNNIATIVSLESHNEPMHYSEPPTLMQI